MKKHLSKSLETKTTIKYFLDYLFDEQIKIQKELNSKVCKKLKPEERNRLYREHCIFTIEEIIEGLRNINHKPWKKTKELDNIDELKDELIDEFRFFLNRCILVSLTPQEFVARFNKSIDKTKKRIKNKY